MMNGRSILLLKLLVVSVLAVNVYADLTADDVLELWKEGHDEKSIKKVIEEENATFSMSKEEIESLRDAGLPRDLIVYMIVREPYDAETKTGGAPSFDDGNKYCWLFGYKGMYINAQGQKTSAHNILLGFGFVENHFSIAGITGFGFYKYGNEVPVLGRFKFGYLKSRYTAAFYSDVGIGFAFVTSGIRHSDFMVHFGAGPDFEAYLEEEKGLGVGLLLGYELLNESSPDFDYTVLGHAFVGGFHLVGQL
jgi:hypothetical protein